MKFYYIENKEMVCCTKRLVQQTISCMDANLKILYVIDYSIGLAFFSAFFAVLQLKVPDVEPCGPWFVFLTKIVSRIFRESVKVFL